MWIVTYEYASKVVNEELDAGNLSECLLKLASKERLRPALIKRLIVVHKGESDAAHT